MGSWKQEFVLNRWPCWGCRCLVIQPRSTGFPQQDRGLARAMGECPRKGIVFLGLKEQCDEGQWPDHR